MAVAWKSRPPTTGTPRCASSIRWPPHRSAGDPIQIGSLQQHIHQRAEASTVLLIEACHPGTVKIEHPQEPFLVNQRHHDLGARRRVAGDVSRKGMHVLDDE